jgi:hypothetical protein
MLKGMEMLKGEAMVMEVAYDGSVGYSRVDEG